MSEEAGDILDELNQGGESVYLLSSKRIATFQPEGKAEACPTSLSIMWTKGDKRFWHTFSCSIPCKNKDTFLLQAPSRLPGLIWSCNPESATIAGTNYLFRELSGEMNFSLVRHLQIKESSAYEAVKCKLFNIAQLVHLTACTSDVLPMELKINAFFSAALNLLMDTSPGGVLPFRPKPPLGYLVGTMGLVLDTCLPGYGEAEDAPSSPQESREENRRPTFWTNLSLHNRCIKCEEYLGSWDRLKDHICPERSGWKCGICSFEATSDMEAKIHYVSLCTRPVSSKCYNCNQDSAARQCQCSTSRQLAWVKIRSFILSSNLFRPENIKILQAINALHGAGRISFVEHEDVAPWNLTITKEDMVVAQDIDLKMDNIIQALPRLEKSTKLEGETRVVFSTNPAQTMPTPQILGMAEQLTSELKDSGPRPASRSSQEEEEEDEEVVWDMLYFSNQEPPLSKEEIDAFVSIWMKADIEGKLKWQQEAVQQDSGYLLEHLGQSGVYQHILPYLPPFKDKETARDDLRVAIAKQMSTLSWLHSVRVGEANQWTNNIDNQEDKKQSETKRNNDNNNKKEEKKHEGQHKEEGEEKRREKVGDRRDRRGSETFECNNEGHVGPKPKFNSNLEKMRHVKKSHPCPFAPQCAFFDEYDSALILHIQRSHPETAKQDKGFACNLCDAKYKEQSQLTGHMERDHPTCAVCKMPFTSMRELRQHQPCLEVRPDVVHKKTDRANGLLVPIHKAELEGYRVGLPEPSILLAQGLADLCEQTDMTPTSRDAILKPILQATALIEAQRKNKLYPFQAKAVKWPLIQAPSFDHPHASRESNKFSDFLGPFDAKDRWYPSYLPSKALPNFYYLKRINDKLASCVAACHLSRETATVLLKQRIHPDTMSAMEAKSDTRAQDFRYEELLLLGQSMFFQLSLEKLQHEAESLGREADEKFHDYFTRCFHLLSTAALGHDEESRSRYVQFHLRRLLLRALSPALRLNIENAELELGVEYTASNILDFYMSNWQMMEERSGALKSQAAQLSGLPIQRIEKNKGQKREKGKKSKAATSISSISQDPPKKAGETKERKVTESPPNQPTPPIARSAAVAEGRPYRDSPAVQNAAPHQPSPRAPFQGMAMNAADAFRQVSSANKRAEFAIAAKAKLGLPPHDMSRFCFRCGAGNEKSSRPYHPAKDCKLPPSDNIHKCPPNIKLFHEEKFCPFGKGGRVGGIKATRK